MNGRTTTRIFIGGNATKAEGGNTRLLDAQRLLEMAQTKNEYKYYEMAIAAFQRAIALGHDVDKAKVGLRDAQPSYATTALVNRDLELAMSLVEPLQGQGREPALPLRRIKDKMLFRRLSRRDLRLFWPVMTLLLCVLFVAGLNFYEYMRRVRHENPELGNLVERVERALNSAASTSIQLEFSALYGLLQVESPDRFRARYQTYDEFMQVAAEGQALFLKAGDGPGKRPNNFLQLHLMENLDVLNDFRHELASEKDNQQLRSNGRLLAHLDSLTQLLITYQKDLENERF